MNTLYNKSVYFFGSLRAYFWKFFLKKIGKKVYIMQRVKIMSPQKVAIGHDVLLNEDVKIGGQCGVTIGNYVLIGYNANIISENHAYHNPLLPIAQQGFYGGKITIHDDVWICANAVILPNVTLGKGCIVGANAVVTHDVPEYAIVGGVPAKVIKYRFGKKEIGKARKKNFSI